MKKVSAIVLVLCILTFVIIQSFYVSADVEITKKLEYEEINLKAGSGITSDVAIGTLLSSDSINECTISVPASAKFSFTSDDGSENDYKFRDVFASRGVSCTIPVITDYISKQVSAGQVSIGHLLELQNTYGYEIGSHTYNHPYLTDLSYEDLIYQLTESKKLDREMGLKISNFFVPYGDYNELVINEAMKLYRSVRISQSGTNTPPDKSKLKAYWLDEGVSLAKAKQIVNTAVLNNQYIIFGFHAGACSKAFMNNTVGKLIDYIQSFDNSQVLTVDKALDRIENVITKNVDVKIADNKIVLDKFFLRSLPYGENIINFNFNDGSSESIKINVSKEDLNKSVTGISVTCLPDKTIYYEGEGFSKSGMQVTAYYSDNSFALIDNYTVSGYDSTPGTKVITVKYEGFETQFNVSVISKNLTTIVINKLPTKLVYTVGESLDLTGLVVSANYNNNTSENVTDYTVSGYSSTPGIKTITVEYKEKTASFTVTVNDLTVGTPTSLKAVSASYNSIKLTWNSVSGAYGYCVYRATSADGPYTLIASPRSLGYTNSSLTTGTTYYYKVCAYVVSGANKTYGYQTPFLSAIPVPKAPTNFKALKYNADSIKLTWYAVPGANGYEIFRSDFLNGTYSLVLSTGACSYINKGLTSGKTYYYKVRAYSLVDGVKVYGDFTTVKSVAL